MDGAKQPTVNTQGFISTEKPEPEKVEPAENSNGDGAFVKPVNGIWTSTLTPLADYTCDWHRWCSQKHYGLTEESKLWALEPREDVEVFVIESQNDLILLLDEFERNDGAISPPDDRYIDFEAMAELYDGLRLTEKAQWKTRMTRPSLYGWDCESTVWFDWAFSDVQRKQTIGEDFVERDC